MHISDGIVPVPLAAAAWGVALVSVARGLRFLTLERVPRAALVSAVVFIAAATVRFPLGVASLHPVLNGLAGILLGPAVLPAYFVGLLLQALLLQFGGVTSLGLNTLILAFPAVGAGYVFRVLRRQFPSKKTCFGVPRLWGFWHLSFLLPFGLGLFSFLKNLLPRLLR